jgi:formylmethanofuran dehydrogenase subunit C
MRRGNIVIGGDIGVNSCRELIAGTVTVLGKIGNAFCRNPRRGTLIIKDRSICKDFIKSNSTDLTFFNFYQMKINNIIDSNVIKNKKPIRYFGTKAEKKMVELFVL